MMAGVEFKRFVFCFVLQIRSALCPSPIVIKAPILRMPCFYLFQKCVVEAKAFLEDTWIYVAINPPASDDRRITHYIAVSWDNSLGLNSTSNCWVLFGSLTCLGHFPHSQENAQCACHFPVFWKNTLFSFDFTRLNNVRSILHCRYNYISVHSDFKYL